MEKIDFAVVGGGIVGLAVGAALSAFGSLAVVERHHAVIQETSSRNSGVVHAGIYYPEDSLKMKLCMRGNENIWRMKGVKAQRIGKWIGSCDSAEDATLESVVANMQRRRIPFEMVSSSRQRELEPLVRMRTIVNSLNTGIVDVHSLADYYQSILHSNDGYLVCDTNVTKVNWTDKGVVLDLRSGNAGADDSSLMLVQKAVVICAGLHGNDFWTDVLQLDGKAPTSSPPAHHRLHFCKGRYVSYRGKPPVSRLVYPCPLPELAGLGVHSVVDSDGRVRFGPDAVYVDDPTNLSVATSPAEEAAFLESQWQAIRRYLPSVEKDRLQMDFCGIRPKLSGPGERARDFLVEELRPDGPGVRTFPFSGTFDASDTSSAKLVMLNGIESPGLTASSALAEMVTEGLVDPALYQKNRPLWVTA